MLDCMVYRWGHTESGVNDLESQLDEEPMISAIPRTCFCGCLHEEHEEWNKSLSSPLDDFQESSQDRHSNNGSKSISFNLIHNPKLDSLLIESIFLLEDKVVVIRPRKRG
jgi:hypothetical protein